VFWFALSCISESESNNANAAVLLDASNNSIEDVRIAGFYDGIRVGANATAQSNVLFNIIGDTKAGTLPRPINIIHIFNTNTVTDLSIIGANNAGGSSATITINDAMTGTSITDTSVAIYALGELSASGGYSRFTTSQSAATWVSSSTGGPSTSCTSSAGGSLYSYSNSTGSGYVLWVCPAGGGAWKHVL
jgi:hypothetical protein